jgi:hypothetical protein
LIFFFSSCSEFVSEEEFFAEIESKTNSKKRKAFGPKKLKKSTLERKTISMEVTDANGFTYTLRKKIRFNHLSLSLSLSLQRLIYKCVCLKLPFCDDRVLDPTAPVYIRMPQAPIPRSWGPPIAPYQYTTPETSPPGSVYVLDSLNT